MSITTAEAVVVAVARGHRDRPRVRVVKDPTGHKVPEPYEIDLALVPAVNILKVLGNEDSEPRRIEIEAI